MKPTFEILDKTTNDIINDLKTHYNVRTKEEIICKAISMLKMASIIDVTEGELIARKGSHETKINIS